MLINPFLGFRMSQGWTSGSHRNNPAMDYATPVGFRFRSPAAGIYRRRASSLSRTDTSAGGHIGELEIVGGQLDGYRIRFCHLDHHVAAHGARVDVDDVLAATGNTGYVRPAPTRTQPHLGAHVHTYGLSPNGSRWNWTLFASAAPAPAADGSAPVVVDPTPTATPETSLEEDTMFIANVKEGNFYLVINGKAAALGKNSGARQSGIPILNFTDDWAVENLKKIVAGIG